MANNAEASVTIRTYLGRRILRKAGEPEYKKDEYGTIEKYAEAVPEAYVHVFATVTAAPLQLFLEPSLCAKGSSGAWVSLQKLVRGDANAPGREASYHEGEIDNWRESFIPKMLEGYEVEPELLMKIAGTPEVDGEGNAKIDKEGNPIYATPPEPFVILDCNKVALEAPLTEDQIIELAMKDANTAMIIKTLLAGIAHNAGVEAITIEELDEEQKASVVTLGRMALGA